MPPQTAKVWVWLPRNAPQPPSPCQVHLPNVCDGGDADSVFRPSAICQAECRNQWCPRPACSVKQARFTASQLAPWSSGRSLDTSVKGGQQSANLCSNLFQWGEGAFPDSPASMLMSISTVHILPDSSFPIFFASTFSTVSQFFKIKKEQYAAQLSVLNLVFKAV